MSKNSKIVLVLILLCIFLTIIPFVVASSDAEFGGADDAAGIKVEEIQPDYVPWAGVLLEKILGGELPGETASLLFCLQAALGAGVLCYGFGFLVARKKFATQE